MPGPISDTYQGHPDFDDHGEHIECWNCDGYGRTAGCFEDCCSGADCDPDDPDLCCAPNRCDVCKGKGGWKAADHQSPMTITTYYPNDAIRLEKLGPRLKEFEAWYSELEKEHAKRDWPYGKASLADATGLCGWMEFFEEGFSPANALDEDLADNYG